MNEHIFFPHHDVSHIFWRSLRMIRIRMLPRRKPVQEWKPFFCFLKEDCTIDECVRGQSELHQRITITDANYVSDNISSDYSRVSAKNYDMKGHAAKNVLDGLANSPLKLLRNSSKRQNRRIFVFICCSDRFVHIVYRQNCNT